MELKERIKAVRESLKLGLIEFSNRIEVSKSSLERYEKGVSEIPVNVVLRIIEEFNIDADWLLFGKGGDKVVQKRDYVEASKLIEAQTKISQLQEKLIEYQSKEIKQLQEQNQGVTPQKVTTA